MGGVPACTHHVNLGWMLLRSGVCKITPPLTSAFQSGGKKATRKGFPPYFKGGGLTKIKGSDSQPGLVITHRLSCRFR